MIRRIKSTISRNLTNSRGWRTNRKIVVIESDDWGSIRMPNVDVYNRYKTLGYNIDGNSYFKYDTLANTDDLNALFDVLLKHRINNGTHPNITFNTVVANSNYLKQFALKHKTIPKKINIDILRELTNQYLEYYQYIHLKRTKLEVIQFRELFRHPEQVLGRISQLVFQNSHDITPSKIEESINSDKRSHRYLWILKT